MTPFPSSFACGLMMVAALMAACSSTRASAQSKEVDPLSLESATPEAPASPANARIFAEAAAGHLQRRFGWSDRNSGRLSLDFAVQFKLGSGWRGSFSNRLDMVDPVPPAAEERVVNSLRESWLGWSTEDGLALAEVGRINLRHGPGYGYNPTDFFRTGALRSPTTADPISLRENRLGTFMLRGQTSSARHTFGLALAPRIERSPDSASFSLDLGSTNATPRLLLTWSSRFGDGLNTQVLAFHDRDRGSQLGANATALLGSAVVTFGEWTYGRDRALDGPQVSPHRAHRAVAGFTLALPAKISLTTELSYNGFGADPSQSQRAAATGVEELLSRLANAQQRQDQWARRAVTVYFTQQGGLTRRLALTALLRRNLDDNSQLAWIEARHRAEGFDVALQGQWTHGSSLSEYGLAPYSRSLQLVGTHYF